MARFYTFGGGFALNDIAGLEAAWFSDDVVVAGGKATQVNDRSGHAYHQTQANPAAQAAWIDNVLNGEPVLRFTGAEYYASPNIDWSAVNEWTVFVVAKSTSIAVDQALASKSWTGWPPGGPQWLLYCDSVSGRQRGILATGPAVFNVRQLDNDDVQSWHVRSWSVDTTQAPADEQHFQWDCGPDADTPAFLGDNPPTGYGNTPIFLGATAALNSFWIGDYAALVVYRRRLNAAERFQVERYLALKYGLPYWTIVPLGDSITYGDAIGLAAGGWRVPLFAANPEIIAGRGSVFAGPGPYRHEGHPGAKIADIQAAVAGYWAASHGSDILLTIGTNDALTPALRAGMAAAYDGLLTTLEALNPAPRRIYCATLTPLGDPASMAAIDNLNAVLATISAGHTTGTLANIGTVLTVADLQVDQIHPNPSGYFKMEQRWAERLQLAA